MFFNYSKGGNRGSQPFDSSAEYRGILGLSAPATLPPDMQAQAGVGLGP